MYSWDLEMLMREYALGASKEDDVIRMELKDIATLCAKCKDDEVYSEAIVRKFCHLIRILNRQHKRGSDRSCMPRQTGTPRYHQASDLLRAFYNHFKKPAEVDYWEIDRVDAGEKREKVNATMKDYVARIQTFANKYLEEVFSADEVGDTDPVLFVYENLEMILARFDTKDGGEPNKQKVNIRSALRKLNEFKYAEGKTDM